MWGQLSTICSNVLKQPNGELLVAVNHNQLRTMASETVDPIDWSHPAPSWAVPPERLVHSINQCNISGTRTCNRSMQGNHLAYAATQGINKNNIIIIIIIIINFHLIHCLLPGRSARNLFLGLLLLLDVQRVFAERIVYEDQMTCINCRCRVRLGNSPTASGTSWRFCGKVDQSFRYVLPSQGVVDGLLV